MENINILVVDDDRDIVRAIKLHLQREGYNIYEAFNGLEALECVSSNNIHLILMDVMMPTLDGLSALMKLREKKNIPVIMLSAKTENSDKVLGLSMGADDYIPKPYQPDELVARVRAQLRRYLNLGGINAIPGKMIINGDMCFDCESHQLSMRGEYIKLTATETKIIELLISNPGRIFPSEEIYERAWNEKSYSCENTVMVHIRRIREKIEINPREPDYLKVVWGIGYKIERH